MLLSFVGPHRVGKSSAALGLANNTGGTFLPTDVVTVFEKHSIATNAILAPEDRLAVQRLVLEHCKGVWDRTVGSRQVYVTDRSPLDIAAYTINDFIYGPDELYYDFMDFLDECVIATEDYFEKVFLLQPEGFLRGRNEPNKGFPSRITQECMNFTFKGLLDLVLDHKVEKIVIPQGLLPQEVVRFCERQIYAFQH
jgi:hypothetical protein